MRGASIAEKIPYNFFEYGLNYTVDGLCSFIVR
jgi:hypothetical protein